LSIRNCSFIQNVVNVPGGVVNGTHLNSALAFSPLISSPPPTGGALAVSGSLLVSACRFIDNVANSVEPNFPVGSAYGGAIGAGGSVMIEHTEFTANTALGSVSEGGSLRVTTVTGVVFLSGLTVSLSSAYTGGGVALVGPSAVLSNCTFVNNSAWANGGGLYLHTVNSLMSNSRFVRNYAYTGGAGFAAYGNYSSLVNVSATDNLGYHGTGAYFDSGVAEWTLGDVSRNIGSIGSGIYFESDVQLATLTSLTLRANTASLTGGALAFAGNVLVAVNCTLVSNIARVYGGGLYVEYGNVVYLIGSNVRILEYVSRSWSDRVA
jgi:hypothetical protein